jgi:carboxypeptidase T
MKHFLLVSITLLVFLVRSEAALVLADSEVPWERGAYRKVITFLHDLALKFPEHASVFQLGESDSGEIIEGLKIGNGPIKNLVVATHHGNEYGSTEVAKAFAASMAETPISDQTVFVIPVLNISGYERGIRSEFAAGREFDPNRDYPGPCGTEGPFHLKSTAALARFMAEENIVASATLHTYFPAVVYPWGLSSKDLSTHYDDLFTELAMLAAVESHYQVGNSTQVIYPADGTFEDYAFWRHGSWSLLFELGYTHDPSHGDVAEMIRVNVPGLRMMMERAPRVKAERHEFLGTCDLSLRDLDRHDE